MVEGNLYYYPSIIFRIICLSIFPLLVFGSFSAMRTCWKAATGPICFLMRATSSFCIPYLGTPFLRTTKPIGTYPFNSSILATTAASDTEGWAISYSYMLAVDNRCPAVFMMSSNLVITFKYPSLSKYPASPVV